MTSYFDDHDLSDSESHPPSSATSGAGPSRLPSSARTLLSTFTSPPAATDASDPTPRDAGRLDLSGLPANSPLRTTLTMLDTLRANLTHTDLQHVFLAGLIQELLGDMHGGLVDSGPPPASKAFIATLPRASAADLADLAKARGDGGGDGEVTCAICTETLDATDSDPRKMPCGHVFDRECLVPWLELRNTCPVCRKEVPTDRRRPEEVRAEARERVQGLFGPLEDQEEEEQAGGGRSGYSSYAGHVDDEDDRHAFGMYS